jgi:hypothetical protein
VPQLRRGLSPPGYYSGQNTDLVFQSPIFMIVFFVNTQTAQIATPSSSEIVYQEADVVQGPAAALTLFSRHGQITDSTRLPAKPNIAAHSVPSFPEIANDLSVFTCKHTVIRTLSLDAHRDDRVDTKIVPCVSGRSFDVWLRRQ